MISGERFARVGELELCYETFGADTLPPLLLVMGLGAQMVLWDDEFCQALASRGLWVIRFDNRDIGRSTILRCRPIPTPAQLLARDPRAAAYSLDDMADDAAGLLEHLDVHAAHVVGVSMGGMIAQLLAIRLPHRVRSLVSIMSNTGDRGVGQPHPDLYQRLLRPVRSIAKDTYKTSSPPTRRSAPGLIRRTRHGCARWASAALSGESTPTAPRASWRRSSQLRIARPCCTA